MKVLDDTNHLNPFDLSVWGLIYFLNLDASISVKLVLKSSAARHMKARKHTPTHTLTLSFSFKKLNTNMHSEECAQCTWYMAHVQYVYGGEPWRCCWILSTATHSVLCIRETIGEWEHECLNNGITLRFISSFSSLSRWLNSPFHHNNDNPFNDPFCQSNKFTLLAIMSTKIINHLIKRRTRTKSYERKCNFLYLFMRVNTPK